MQRRFSTVITAESLKDLHTSSGDKLSMEFSGRKSSIASEQSSRISTRVASSLPTLVLCDGGNGERRSVRSFSSALIPNVISTYLAPVRVLDPKEQKAVCSTSFVRPGATFATNTSNVVKNVSFIPRVVR